MVRAATGGGAGSGGTSGRRHQTQGRGGGFRLRLHWGREPSGRMSIELSSARRMAAAVSRQSRLDGHPSGDEDRRWRAPEAWLSWRRTEMLMGQWSMDLAPQPPSWPGAVPPSPSMARCVCTGLFFEEKIRTQLVVMQ